MTNWISKEVLKIQPMLKNNDNFIFATGYGPSGLPHIGTFAEVYRTVALMKAVKALNPEKKFFLYAFSDDLDGLRKIPDNVPNKEMLKDYIGVALTSIPDPFGTHASYGDHMNNRLCSFLDNFGFDYEFKSATECYKKGIYNEALLKILENYEEVVSLVVPNVGEERAKTYSPFLPICPKTNRVLQVPITKINKEKGTIYYQDENNEEIETLVTNGKCKLQWKADWGMRWSAFKIGYEMHGKDLTPSARISSQICREIGGVPPMFFCYELFLDEEGKKISKSKGNGLSMEEWLRYAPIESLKFYLLHDPSKARKLFFGMIPKSTDEYIEQSFLYNHESSLENKINNPIWYIDNEDDLKNREKQTNITFSMLLNLVSASNSENSKILWGFIKNYDGEICEGRDKFFDRMVECAILYYKDFIKPYKQYYKPNNQEKDALRTLMNNLSELQESSDIKDIQNMVLAAGKDHGYTNLREWFLLIYKSFFGQEDGPRMGSFIKIYGIKNFINLMQQSIDL